MKNNNRIKKLALITGALVCSLNACNYVGNSIPKDSTVIDNPENKQENDVNSDVVTDNNTENIIIADNETVKPEQSNPSEGTAIVDPVKKPPTSTKKPSGSSSTQKPNQGGTTEVGPVVDDGLSEYWDTLSNIVESGQNYYTEYFSKTRLISKNGKLYNKAAELYVDTNFLCDSEGLESKYRGVDADVLLLYGSDLQKYSELSIKSADSGLTVFAASKHPTEDKYLITSSESRGGVLSGTKYRALLNKYSQKHGTIKRLHNDNSEYDRILTFISMFESKYEKYYVRNITVDDKYASVVLSSQSNTSDVRQYILVKDNNFWEVVMDGIEKEPRVVVAVNKKLPDFNVDMLPSYTINDFSMKSNFSDVYQILLDNFYIENINELGYVAGTSNYSYIASSSGIKYLFMVNSKGWYVSKVETPDEAYNLMIANDKNAPTFLIPDRY